MSEFAASGPDEVPTFSECVVGYRAWRVDGRDRLWPISDRRSPWEPRINDARCNYGVDRARGGLAALGVMAVGCLSPIPEHEAPGADCTCGLYSWRRPPSGWGLDHRLATGSVVCGAVTSWGRLHVHGDGFRAEHACVVALAYPSGTGADEVRKLDRVAARYRVELVPLDRLEEVASRHGSPLPDWLLPEEEPEAIPPRGTPLEKFSMRPANRERFIPPESQPRWQSS